MAGNNGLTVATTADLQQLISSDRRASSARTFRTGTEARPSVVIGPAVFNNVNGLFQSYAPMAYMMPFELLDYIELLATYNPDYSQAVENVRTLANPGHTLIVQATTGVATKLKQQFWEKDRQIQRRHGGIEGLIDKLLWQAAVYGAMCGEFVPNENMTDVVDFIDVNPKTIRFFWETDQELDPWEFGPHWAPYQRATAQQIVEAEMAGQAIKNGAYVKLNEVTFQYFAFNAASGSPYGVPPFLAALNNLATQRDMVFNLSQVVKKLALFGLVDVKVAPLKMNPGETPDAFQARAQNYIQTYANQAQSMLDDGGLVHFNDSEITTTNLSSNASGATNIFTQNEEQVFSGLKSMPSLQGRSYSTTETYAGVAYDVMIRNSIRYQRAARMMVEYGYYLMAQLWGQKVQRIDLKFWQNKSLQRKETAMAEHYEILNQLFMWAAGITNQVDMAHNLGYADPDTPLDEVPNNPLFTASSALKEPDDEGPETKPAGKSGKRTSPEGEEEAAD